MICSTLGGENPWPMVSFTAESNNSFLHQKQALQLSGTCTGCTWKENAGRNIFSSTSPREDRFAAAFTGHAVLQSFCCRKSCKEFRKGNRSHFSVERGFTVGYTTNISSCRAD